MNSLNDISDEEFLPFLHSLGAETYKKSFEWMLTDRGFGIVLRWLYTNLDHNNALNSREECRYIELQKKGALLTAEDLETSIAQIQEQYEGICLPGDQESKEDVNSDISMMKERLHMLERQETALKEMERKNELIKEELNLEITKLNSAYHQCTEDETTTAEECVSLAQEVEAITQGIMSVIADKLDLYASCHTDKEKARKFFTFGPFETYRQSQALYRSQFDLFTSKKFGNRQNHAVSDEEIRSVLTEARSMEERLSDAIGAYIESKAELSSEHAMLALVANYDDVHSTQVAASMMESQSGLDLLEQEESILDQQLTLAARQLVEGRTNLAVETTARSALAVREQIHNDLAYLLDTTQQAFYLDRVLYLALRHELRTTENCMQFAADLRRHVIAESDAVSSRIESMNEICSKQEACELNQQASDKLLHAVYTILGSPNNEGSLIKMCTDVQNNIRELKDSVTEAYNKKLELFNEFKKSTKPLREYVWDGCTKQPNCRDRTVGMLVHSLTQHIDNVEKRVVESSSMFATVKNGDKQCLRKLWQWFLTDPGRLLSAMKNSQ